MKSPHQALANDTADGELILKSKKTTTWHRFTFTQKFV